MLAYYFTNSTARHHLRDLAERLSLDPSNLSKELGRLERDGLFRSEMSGRQKYFQLNREYPLLNEVRKIVAKTIGAAPLIAQSLKRIEGIDEAYLYGSFASNQQDAASDIDVLVIGSPREEDLAEAAGRLFHDVTGVFHHAGTEERANGPAPEHADYGSFAAFSDPDGNGWLLQEIKTRLPGR